MFRQFRVLILRCLWVYVFGMPFMILLSIFQHIWTYYLRIGMLYVFLLHIIWTHFLELVCHLCFYYTLFEHISLNWYVICVTITHYLNTFARISVSYVFLLHIIWTHFFRIGMSYVFVLHIIWTHFLELVCHMCHYNTLFKHIC